MTKQRGDQLAWVSGIVVLGAILLLGAHIHAQRWTDPESSVGGSLTALVNCILPATVDNPPAPAAGTPEAEPLDCDALGPHPLRSAWMTAC